MTGRSNNKEKWFYNAVDECSSKKKIYIFISCWHKIPKKSLFCTVTKYNSFRGMNTLDLCFVLQCMTTKYRSILYHLQQVRECASDSV